MDMIAHNFNNEIEIVGLSSHWPFLKEYFDHAFSLSPFLKCDNNFPMGMQSDHKIFNSYDIPFIYFGVSDHPDYHRPTDTFDRINHPFFINYIHFIVDFITVADSDLKDINKKTENYIKERAVKILAIIEEGKKETENMESLGNIFDNFQITQDPK